MFWSKKDCLRLLRVYYQAAIFNPLIERINNLISIFYHMIGVSSRNKLVLSAYVIKLVRLDTLKMSLIYAVIRRGPSMLPWDSPALMSCVA